MRVASTGRIPQLEQIAGRGASRSDNRIAGPRRCIQRLDELALPHRRADDIGDERFVQLIRPAPPQLGNVRKIVRVGPQAGLRRRLGEDAQSLARIGDGTYLMNPTEIVTAVQEGLKLTIIVSENHGYQCIRGLQLGRAGHSFGNEFRTRNPQTGRLDGDYVAIDFVKNAESMGARAWYVTTPDELRDALCAARAEDRPCVIVAATDMDVTLPGSGVWMDIAVAEVSQDPRTQELRAEYERNRMLQRLHV